MRRSSWLLGVVLAVGLPLAAADSASPPKIAVDQSVRNFGAVRQGQVLELTYDVKNEGGQPLTLEVRPTCGCTVVDFDKTIAPGESGKVEAKIDTKEFSGPITKSVLVVSNDPERPTLRLLARADVRPVVEVLPRPIVRMGAVAGTDAEAKVVLAPAEAGQDFEITTIQSSVPYLTASFRKLGDGEMVQGHPGPQYEINLVLTKDAPPGMVKADITVRTTLNDAPIVGVKVVGRVTTVAAQAPIRPPLSG
jgi:hypothetical protein